MVKTLTIKWIPAAAAVSAGSACYILVYLLMQYIGLFRPMPSGLFRVLHQWPVLAGFGVLFLASLFALTVILVKSGMIKAAGNSRQISYAILHLGIMGLTAGVFLSALTRFEGTLVLTEGQEIGLSNEVMDPDTIYVRPLSWKPGGKLALHLVDPVFARDGRKMERTFAMTSIIPNGRPDGRQQKLDSRFPHLVDGAFYQVGDSGYSVLFQLLDGGGNIIDEAYAVLNLFPPGAEDAIRVIQIPHTIYLRYYPDVSVVSEKKGPPPEKSGPLFKVRVARNLDLLYNDFVSPDEFVQVDGFHISFRDVRRWVDIRIVRDPGLYLIAPGLISLLAAGGFLAYSGLMGRDRLESDRF